MSETVESLLNSKKQGELFEKLYSSVSDIRGFTQDTALELMLSNEQVQGITSSLRAVGKQISASSQEIINTIKAVRESGLSAVVDDGYKEIATAIRAIPSSNESGVMDAGYTDLSKDELSGYTKSLVPVVERMHEIIEGGNALMLPEMKASSGYLSKLADPTWVLRVMDRELSDEVKKLSDMLYANRDDSSESMATDMEVIRLSNEDMVYYMREQSRFLESIYGELKKPEPTQMPEKPNKPKDDGDGVFGGLFDDMLGLFGLSGLIGRLKGFFGKMAKRWTNTLKGVGTFLDNVLAKVFSVIGRISKFFKLDKALNLIAKPFKYIGSLLKKIPVVGKLFEFLGKGVARLFPFVKGGLKFAKAIPVIGWAITALTSILDFGAGIKDAAKIVGKKKGDLNLLDKINAGLSGLISGLTFGLVSPKTIYKFIKMFEDALSTGFTGLWNMLPGAMQEKLKSFWSFLFDKDKGLLGAIPSLIEGILDQMAGGHYMKAVWNTLLLIPKAIASVVPRMFNFVIDKASEMLSNLLKSADEMGLTKLLKPIIDGITAPIKAIFEMLGNLIPASVTSVMKKASGVFGGAVDSIMKWADPESEKRNAKSYDYQSSVDSIKKLMDSGNTKDAGEEYKKLLVAYNKDKSIKQDPVLAADLNKEIQRAYGIVSQRSNVVPDAGKTIQLSKNRMDQKQPPPNVTVNPVVVPIPQPQKQSVSRRKEGSMDKGLAFTNYGG